MLKPENSPVPFRHNRTTPPTFGVIFKQLVEGLPEECYAQIAANMMKLRGWIGTDERKEELN